MKKLAFIIAGISILFCVVGAAFVMSASSAYSNFQFKDLFHLFNSHIIKVFFGILFLIGFAFFPYDYYKKYSKWLIFGITAILIYTLVFAPDIKGAGRRINFFFISFQPAELARLVLIIHLAYLIEKKGELILDFKNGFMYLYFWVIVISGLIFAQPNVSNGLIIIMIALTVLYVGGAKLKHIFSATFFSFTGVLAIAMIFSHSRDRIITFAKSLFFGGEINKQVTEALYALGSGGWLGQGLGNSKQSNLFLPEAYGDFIFAIIGEEIGFIGTLAMLSGYMIIFVLGLKIAKNAKDTFGQLLAFGISVSIMVNAFINIAVTTGMVPTTGIPLPFISYGGTSILITCASIGALFNIAVLNARYVNYRPRLNYNHAEEAA